MVGSFGESNRAWCGLLEVDQNGKPSANIFFEARYVAKGRSTEQASANRTTAFQPDGLSQLRHADGKEYVLVDRRGLSRLQIDLETLEVSVPKKVIGVKGDFTQTDLGFSGRLFLRDGRPIWARSTGQEMGAILCALRQSRWRTVNNLVHPATPPIV